MTDSSRDALRTALFYGVVSILWFVVCDLLLPNLIEDPARLAFAQQMSGYVWILISAFLIFIARTRLLRFMGVDVSLRQQREDHERLRLASAVFDSTREGVVVTDQQGLIVHVNRAFMEITGYQPD
jgi:PAS domain-containing protein